MSLKPKRKEKRNIEADWFSNHAPTKSAVLTVAVVFSPFKELLRWENFLRSIGLPDDMVRRLFNKETVIGSGELYSKEHSKRFKAENASLKLEQDKAKPENIRFTINGTDIFDWFKLQQKEFLQNIGANVSRQNSNRRLEL